MRWQPKWRRQREKRTPSRKGALLTEPSERVQRLALSKAEAAMALGVSVDYLEEHVLADLRVVRRGRKVLGRRRGQAVRPD